MNFLWLLLISSTDMKAASSVLKIAGMLLRNGAICFWRMTEAESAAAVGVVVVCMHAFCYFCGESNSSLPFLFEVFYVSWVITSICTTHLVNFFNFNTSNCSLSVVELESPSQEGLKPVCGKMHSKETWICFEGKWIIKWNESEGT